MILCIDTGTDVCSAALCSREKVVSLRRSQEGKAHAVLLTVFIKELLEEQNKRAAELDAVAVSKGPGSFTGLRIGVSVAKGIAFAAGIPLIGIDSLKVLFHGMTESAEGMKHLQEDALFCPMIDARRMEAYYCIFSSSGERLQDVSAGMPDEKYFLRFGEGKKIIFFGSGSGKFAGLISHPGALFIDGFDTSAGYMRTPAYKAADDSILENMVSFEPFYLKDFIATRPVKKIV